MSFNDSFQGYNFGKEHNVVFCKYQLLYQTRKLKKKSLALDNILRTKIKIWFLGKNQIASSHIPHR